MPTFAILALFSVLLLIVPVQCVCKFCYGGATSYGCDGSGNNCPWNEGVTSNTAAVAALIGGTAVATAVSVSKLLPLRFRSIFSRSTLDCITAILSRPKNGVEFDPAGKTIVQLVSAVKSGQYSKMEAILHLTNEMNDVDDSADHAEAKMKKYSNNLQLLRDLPNVLTSGQATRGVYLFLLAKLSAIVCTTKDLTVTLDACMDCEPEAVGGSSSSSSATTSSSKSSATLVRPKSVGAMMMLLNDFTLCCAALGVATPLVLCPFLADVVFTPILDGALEWPVAFELLVLYLQEIERQPDHWTLVNVYGRSGAIDVRRKEATTIAKARYPPACFRVPGGNPGSVGKKPVGEVKEFNSSSKRGCIAWNNNSPHEAKHLDSNGRCKFNHACNQWVTDKGKNAWTVPRGSQAL